MTEPSGPLGEAINSALASSGMTVEQVSASTRIRATLIRDLAAGRTASSGGDVYARGHLRAIAHATHTDPTPLLEAYALESGVPTPEPVALHTVPVQGRRAGSLSLPRAEAPERRGPHWMVAAVAMVALVIVGLVVVGTVGNKTPANDQALPPEPSSTPTAAPAPATAAPEAPAPPAPVGPDAVASLAPTAGAALRVRVIGGSSWVLVKSGATKMFEGLLSDGTVRDFNDPASLEVKVGNAGVVSLICGGKDVLAGGSGQVKSFTCAPSGLAPV